MTNDRFESGSGREGNKLHQQRDAQIARLSSSTHRQGINNSAPPVFLSLPIKYLPYKYREKHFLPQYYIIHLKNLLPTTVLLSPVPCPRPEDAFNIVLECVTVSSPPPNTVYKSALKIALLCIVGVFLCSCLGDTDIPLQYAHPLLLLPMPECTH